MQLDVFTLVPHAFAWLTEQRPVASVLGGELDLRLFSYRDYTPLKAGQVDDEPYGGGPGMVLRIDVVVSALEAVYGGNPGHRVVALTPQGRIVMLIGDGQQVKADAFLTELAGKVGAKVLAIASQSRKDWGGGPPKQEHLIAIGR